MHVQYMQHFLVHLCTCICTWWVHLFKVCTLTVWGRVRESEWSSTLLLFCRVFITLRGPALIMHGYMAPQTSQCFTGGKKKAALQDDTEQHRESALPHTLCRAFYLLVTSANSSSILIYLPDESPIQLFIYSFIHSSVFISPFLSRFVSQWL